MYKNSKDLFWELVKTNFKLRYNNSILGFVWVLIKPFAMFGVLYFVWTAFRGGNTGDNFQVNLLLGIVLYTFVNESVIFGMNGLLDKAHIILKVNFPREIAVMSSLAMGIINLSINMLIYIVISLFNPVTPTIVGISWFILTIFVLTVFIYGLSLYLSIFLIKLRDLEHVFELIFMLLFWATPIFYEIGNGPGQVGGTVGKIISLNPLGWVINIAREALINGKIAEVTIWNNEISSIFMLPIITFLAVLILLSGKVYFNKQVKKVAEFF